MKHYLLILVLALVASGLAKRHRKRARRSHDSYPSSRGRDDESGSTRFPSSPRSIYRGDSTLIRLIGRYMRKLYPPGPKEETLYTELLLNEAREAAFRAPVVVPHWYPIECRFLGLELQRVATIHRGRRNLVLKLYDLKGEKNYAWKRYENADEYTSEMSFYMVADHPNIVKAVCTQRCQRTGYPGILMEFAEGGGSLAYARRHGQDQKKLLRLAAQMYDVLKYMHWLGFVHADFKPENVMIDAEGNALAIDFGFATPVPYGRHGRGTPTTLAPELAKAVQGPILENIDTWALGSTIAQLWGAAYGMKGRKGSHSNHKWVPMRISNSYGYAFGPLPDVFSEELCQLMYYTMNPDPEMRMLNTPTQLDWFESLAFWKGIDFETVGVDWRGLLNGSSNEGDI